MPIDPYYIEKGTIIIKLYFLTVVQKNARSRRKREKQMTPNHSNLVSHHTQFIYEGFTLPFNNGW